MNKKPSDRIKEIGESKPYMRDHSFNNLSEGTTYFPEVPVQAIIQYLDEERERVDGILRAVVNDMPTGIPVKEILLDMIDGTLLESETKK